MQVSVIDKCEYITGMIMMNMAFELNIPSTKCIYTFIVFEKINIIMIVHVLTIRYM